MASHGFGRPLIYSELPRCSLLEGLATTGLESHQSGLRALRFSCMPSLCTCGTSYRFSCLVSCRQSRNEHFTFWSAVRKSCLRQGGYRKFVSLSACLSVSLSDFLGMARTLGVWFFVHVKPQRQPPSFLSPRKNDSKQT